MCYYKIMERLKQFLLSSRAKTFYWQTANGFVALAIVFFADIEWQYTPILIAVLNAITKYINKNYL